MDNPTGTLDVYTDSEGHGINCENAKTWGHKYGIYATTTGDTIGGSTAVYGNSSSATGNNHGFQGITITSSTGTNYGVYGYASNSGAGESYGVYGRGGVGVYGWSTSGTGYGVYAENTNADGTGLYAVGGANGYAAEFDGRVRILSGGRLLTPVLEITGADLAEQFPFSEAAEPGMVVAINQNSAGKLSLARGAYNRRVAGIVAGANDFSTGLVLGKDGEDDTLKLPVALTGRVYCRADATKGPIEPGDLLTTSDVPGHAMKVTDYTRAQGAILGKAMSSLESGKGLVLVLVSLQ
jgi:hypothetical protein